METLAIFIAIAFFIIGLVGVVLPILPGTLLIFAGMLVYGFMTGFENLSLYFFLVQGIAAVLIFFIDHVAAAIGTKKFGGTNKSTWAAIAGMIFGTIFMGPLGLFIGAFGGAVIVEMLGGTPARDAMKVGVGVLVGFLGSLIIKLIISLAMITWFFIRIF